MAKYLVYGAKNKSGIYEGHAYDNYVLQCVSLDENADCGKLVETVKVSKGKLADIFGTQHIEDICKDPTCWNFEFNKYGQVFKANKILK